jgi:hypothetical protein
MDVHLKAAPDLTLLLELEPAHRIFFRNLTDAVFRRSPPSFPTTTKPARFWKDVFVPTGLPWGSFVESMLLHLAVLSVAWTISQSWVRQEQIRQRIEARRSFVTYYPPSYPARGSSAPRPRPQPKNAHSAARQSPMRVARERPKNIPKPPDVKLAQNEQPANLTSSSAPARTPIFAPKLSQRPVPAGLASAIAPAPDVGQATSRRLGISQSSVIAPPPEAGPVLSGRAVAAPSAAVILPPPSLQSSMEKARTGKPGKIDLGHPEVVEPSPRLTADKQGGHSRTVLASLGPSGTLVIPPAPSAATAGARSGFPVGSSLSAVAQVVPPPVSMKGTGSIANGRVTSGLVALVVPPPPSAAGGIRSPGSPPGRSLSAGSQVVPPAQSMKGTGGIANGRVTSGLVALVVPPSPSVANAGGRPGAGQSSFFGSGSHVVPPSPAVQGTGHSPGGGRGNSLSGAGSQVVPPPQSIRGSDGIASGRQSSGFGTSVVPPSPTVSGAGRSDSQAGSLLGSGSLAVPPPPSVESAGNSSGSGRLAAMGVSSAVPPPPAIDSASEPATIELPVRVIGLALALPNSSYFSNYEVFIAERRLKRGGSELIKLVSVSLPYQPRLSEYGVDNTKVYKLVVKRDPSCDETLMQMTWPEADQAQSASPYANGAPAPAPGDRNNKLPCYRTTADDYWRALSGTR